MLPGFLIFYLLGEYKWFSIIVPLFSALRLAKFNIDSRQKQGFIGVPTPINALFVSSLTFVFQGNVVVQEINYLLILLVLYLSFKTLHRNTKMKYIAEINVMPQREILDPQGKAVKLGLHNLGIDQVQEVRIGKHITLELDAENEQLAKEKVELACKKLLANLIMENYEYVILPKN